LEKKSVPVSALILMLHREKGSKGNYGLSSKELAKQSNLKVKQLNGML
jgi:hypothetical protein